MFAHKHITSLDNDERENTEGRVMTEQAEPRPVYLWTWKGRRVPHEAVSLWSLFVAISSLTDGLLARGQLKLFQEISSVSPLTPGQQTHTPAYIHFKIPEDYLAGNHVLIAFHQPIYCAFTEQQFSKTFAFARITAASHSALYWTESLYPHNVCRSILLHRCYLYCLVCVNFILSLTSEGMAAQRNKFLPKERMHTVKHYQRMRKDKSGCPRR